MPVTHTVQARHETQMPVESVWALNITLKKLYMYADMLMANGTDLVMAPLTMENSTKIESGKLTPGTGS